MEVNHELSSGGERFGSRSCCRLLNELSGSVAVLGSALTGSSKYIYRLNAPENLRRDLLRDLYSAHAPVNGLQPFRGG